MTWQLHKFCISEFFLSPFDYADHKDTKKTKLVLFICLVMRLYRESHENVCSHISVFTWICIHKQFTHAHDCIPILNAYIFELWKEFRIT